MHSVKEQEIGLTFWQSFSYAVVHFWRRSSRMNVLQESLDTMKRSCTKEHQKSHPTSTISAIARRQQDVRHLLHDSIWTALQWCELLNFRDLLPERQDNLLHEAFVGARSRGLGLKESSTDLKTRAILSEADVVADIAMPPRTTEKQQAV